MIKIQILINHINLKTRIKKNILIIKLKVNKWKKTVNKQAKLIVIKEKNKKKMKKKFYLILKMKFGLNLPTYQYLLKHKMRNSLIMTIILHKINKI